MELTASDLWSRILESARTSLPEQSFRTWLSGTRAVALAEGELVVEAPSEFHLEWLEDKYAPMLTEVAERTLGRPIRLTFQAGAGAEPVPTVELRSPDDRASVGPSRRPPGGGSRAGPGGGPREPAPKSRAERNRASPGPSVGRARPGINERYTFERFVVGNNNQLASAACHAVAEKPARAYNPLFLYGGVGLGKTHLMHAIGNQILAADLEKHIVYVSSEQFTNELVTSIQEGTMGEFRRRYRRMDLLLVDDIHFLEGKERTQEEFFHTFNALYDAHRQIVLTSDRPPKEIPGLEDRLVSRFEWGLVADIKPPDYETRVAILRKKASDDNLTLDDEVIDFIARSCTASVRELEGAIIKLLAYSSLKNQEVTVGLARTALSSMLGDGHDERGSRRERLTPERIREVVARRWNVKPAALESKRRTRDLTVPRQVAMYLIKEILDTSLVRIGDSYGGRDHSTVIHSIRKVEETMEEDERFRREVEGARSELTEEV
ncbi:MAG: chromosomal replication initiator protein DnaA [Gemmatimonadota bacterium]|jgi:chromosomal replication initiator protein